MKLLLLLFVTLLSVTVKAQIIPTPMFVQEKDGVFELKNNTKISYGPKGANPAKELLSYITNSTGYTFEKTEKKIRKGILFTTAGADTSLGKEGYILEITPKLIVIRATDEAGMFYAVQSLVQLFPPEIFSKTVQQNIQWKVPCLIVKDKPKYSYRAFMLDSSRQFQTTKFIKRYLDLLALMKINVFHWHLTDGQGWRIEIKKYPKLTSVGAYVAKGKEQQGYYTREDIKDIVTYAAENHIMVIPEIDVPGHSEAALTAYPEYTCLKKAPETVMTFTSHIFCGGYEETYTFLENILDEVCEMFPGEYIHLGGDEAPKNDWDKCPVCQAKIKEEGLKNSNDLQLYFSKRLADYLKTKNKKVIFWGDVMYHEGTVLPDNVVVEWWNYRGHKDLALKNSIKNGHPVVASTNYYCYLNFPVTPWSMYNIKRTFNIKQCYKDNPSDIADPDPLVLGMSANLWTDWYVRMNMVDKRVFPRILALTEEMWHVGDKLPFDTFYGLVKSKYKTLKILGVDYGPAMPEDIKPGFSWE